MAWHSPCKDSLNEVNLNKPIKKLLWRKHKSKKGGVDDGEMEWWVKYKSETESKILDYSYTLPKDE